MQTEPLLKTKISRFSLVVLFTAGIILGIASWKVTELAFEDLYANVMLLGIGILCGIASLLFLFSVLLLRSYEVYDDRLVVKNVFDEPVKEIQRKEIDCWAEIKGEAEYRHLKRLVLFSRSGRIKIDSLTCSFYQVLMIILTKNLPENSSYLTIRKRRIRLINTVAALSLALLCFWGSFYLYKFPPVPVKASETAQISGALNHNPEIEGGSKGGRWIHLFLDQYPKFKFDISGHAIHAMAKEDFVSEVGQGDTVMLLISKDDYHDKIRKESMLDFLGKQHDLEIQVLGVASPRYVYLSLGDYNKELLEDNKIGIWLCGAFGIFFCWLTVYTWRRKK